jgi:flagellar biosynthesis protein FlhG
MATESRKARRIAVVSGKGGVGKSIITANLAAALASIGRRILVVDADLGLANIDVILDVAPEFTIHDALNGTRSLSEVVVPTKKGFDLIPAGSGLTEGAILTTNMAENIAAMLHALEERYHAILFDAGAGIGEVVLFFANIADEILLVVTPEPTSMMDAYATIKILHQLHGRHEFLLIVNQTNPNCSNQIGASIAGHLQTVASKYLESSVDPIKIELVESIPIDPMIPRSIRQRQLLTETGPEAPSTCVLNHLAGILDTRISCRI